jgi:peptide/nickel transport system ATP-binding protein
MTPSLLALPPGCAFQARCARADGACRAAPPLLRLPERQLRCFHPHSADAATTA